MAEKEVRREIMNAREELKGSTFMIIHDMYVYILYRYYIYYIYIHIYILGCIHTT